MKKISAVVGVTMLLVAGIVVYQVKGNVSLLKYLKGELTISSITTPPQQKWGCGDGTCKLAPDGVYDTEDECNVYIGTASCGTLPSSMPGGAPTPLPQPPMTSSMPNVSPTPVPVPQPPQLTSSTSTACTDLVNSTSERRVFNYLQVGYEQKLNVDAQFSCESRREEPAYCRTMPNCRNTIEAGQGSNLEKPVAVSYTVTYGPTKFGNEWEMRFVCNYKRYCERNPQQTTPSYTGGATPSEGNTYCCSATSPTSCIYYKNFSECTSDPSKSRKYNGKYDDCVKYCNGSAR